MITDYAIADSGSTDQDKALLMLITNVKFSMKEGWQPQGGVLYRFNSTKNLHVFSQALVKFSRIQEP